MAVTGFYCLKTGVVVSLGACEECKNPCLPSPLLCAVLQQESPPAAIDGKPVFRVTELISQPLRIAYLKRIKDYPIKIAARINAFIGTSVHKLISGGEPLPERWVSEKRFERDFGDFIISGTPDLYDTDNKILYDFKVVKKYELKAGNPDYVWQLNAYRVLAFPEAKEMRLVYILKDWTAKDEFEVGLPVQGHLIERIDDKEVLGRLLGRAAKLKKFLERQEMPEICSSEETWGGKRCSLYCDVESFCLRRGKK